MWPKCDRLTSHPKPFNIMLFVASAGSWETGWKNRLKNCFSVVWNPVSTLIEKFFNNPVWNFVVLNNCHLSHRESCLFPSLYPPPTRQSFEHSFTSSSNTLCICIPPRWYGSVDRFRSVSTGIDLSRQIQGARRSEVGDKRNWKLQLCDHRHQPRHSGAYHAAGQLPEALQLAEETLSLMKKNLGAGHPETDAGLGDRRRGHRRQPSALRL